MSSFAATIVRRCWVLFDSFRMPIYTHLNTPDVPAKHFASSLPGEETRLEMLHQNCHKHGGRLEKRAIKTRVKACSRHACELVKIWPCAGVSKLLHIAHAFPSEQTISFLSSHHCRQNSDVHL
uniref:Uncharacterized protein n=1 Tax=Physcomitrium patens TaxID=3218 RepID=A0A2K1IMP9_PHYPA|nr:hypothetical protein PHYPA_026871 [Physcomitrium patens]